MSVADVEKAVLDNPDAKAVLVNNPTYYGICSDIRPSPTSRTGTA
jgi:arginine/lysine/ornithine decarboxylase